MSDQIPALRLSLDLQLDRLVTVTERLIGFGQIEEDATLFQSSSEVDNLDECDDDRIEMTFEDRNHDLWRAAELLNN